MDLKQLLSDLYLGMKGFGSILRIYGPGGSANDAYVGLQAPATDFIPAVYVLPEVNTDGYMYNTAGVLSFVEGMTRYELTEPGEIPNVVPAGYRLTELTIFNVTAYDILFDLGSTLDGTNIAEQETVPAGGWISFPMNRYFSYQVATSLFFASESFQDFDNVAIVIMVDKKFICIP